MAYSVKSSLLGFWIVFILAIFLWYRNYKYDRIMSAIAIILGLFQLIEYGIYNNMNPHQGGKLIFSVLWLLLFILAMGTLIFIKSSTALIWMIIIATVFLFAVTYAFTSEENTFNVVRDGEYLLWTRENSGILNGLEFIYILGILVPILLLLIYYRWEDFGLYVIVIYLFVSFIILWYLFESRFLGSLWVYSLIGMIMLIWFIGMFHP